MQITIKSAAIKGSIFLKYAFDHVSNDTKFSNQSSGDAPIHEDLRSGFETLIPHFAFICEEINEKECRQAIDDFRNGVMIQGKEEGDLPTNPLPKYYVTGFTLGKESEGVTISGSKELISGKSLVFNTPFMKWDDLDNPFVQDLMEAIEVLKSEVYQYIEGKRAPMRVQTSLEFDDEEVTENFEQDSSQF